MKTLQLEVGKTYRSREGEEVKIVRMGNSGWDYWEGSNGEWYYEGGKWSYVSKEHPEDLIEEVRIETTRHTFKIPEGVKKVTVEQVGNRIVVEMVPEAKEPKPEILKEGDIVFEDGRIMIVKMHPNFYHAMFYPNYGKLHINGQYGIPFTSAAFRPATPEEAQPLWDALKKAGKRWNAETMQVEDVPEIDRIREWVEEEDKGPKPGDVMVNIHGNVYIFKEVVGEDVHKCYAWAGEGGRLTVESLCFYGRPATPEEAQPLWDALRKAGKRWNPETMQVEEIPEKEQIDNFLKAYADGVIWSREQLRWLIENYLKHREGKNET